MKKAIQIRMDSDILSELDEYAVELERSRTYLIEKAVTAYFDTLDELISDRRIDGVKSGKEEVYSLAEVRDALGIYK